MGNLHKEAYDYNGMIHVPSSELFFNFFFFLLCLSRRWDSIFSMAGDWHWIVLIIVHTTAFRAKMLLGEKVVTFTHL